MGVLFLECAKNFERPAPLVQVNVHELLQTVHTIDNLIGCKRMFNVRPKNV